jgi:hypothetical protein
VSIGRTKIHQTGKHDEVITEPMKIVADNKAVCQVRFGSVTVDVAELDTKLERLNIRKGQIALKRASKILSKPGVLLGPSKRNVPYFRADPRVRGRVIRVLNGKKTVGVFVDGAFTKLKA